MCNVSVNSNRYTLRLRDNKDTLDITGHKECIDGVYEKINNSKNYNKLTIMQALKEVGLSLNELV